ncbi:hypothetical protein Bca52824_087987 [Brassica carinata]|uniref:Uncharacterized protein n=1 Tax=Brassica carinata TaxID=52824 RepID=A0A8X7P986_BRACI|nr:hypothetical protein Bca52824_087987 [Brassica carinata]
MASVLSIRMGWLETKRLSLVAGPRRDGCYRQVSDRNIETAWEEELCASACLRVGTFNELNPSSYDIKSVILSVQREFEALKDRVSGKEAGVFYACILLPLLSQLSTLASEDLTSACKFSDGIEDRVVVGALILNQCRWLPDEISGTKPEVFLAYLSNICVAKELHRNGVGYKLNDKSKLVAREWGITDMYVHVTVHEKLVRAKSAEPAWQIPQQTTTAPPLPSYYLLIHVQINGLRRHQDAKVVGTRVRGGAVRVLANQMHHPSSGESKGQKEVIMVDLEAKRLAIKQMEEIKGKRGNSKGAK